MWVARDKDGTLNLWFNKPKRAVNFWYCQQKQDGWKATKEFIQNKHEIDGKQFPKLTWEDEPINVYIYSSEYSDLVESKRKFDWDKIHDYCRNHCRSYDDCIKETDGVCDRVMKMFEICG